MITRNGLIEGLNQAQASYVDTYFDWSTYGTGVSTQAVGKKIASGNTIKLDASASASDDYYNGYDIIVTRVSSTGITTEQRKTVLDYTGSTKIAVIDGIWDNDFIPKSTDSYKIVPKYADGRVSINPAIQTLDYVTSERYGRNLNPLKDLVLESWLESGRICDTQSDVSVKMSGASASGVAVGAIYKYEFNGVLFWQGKVQSTYDSSSNGYITFTECIGKLLNQWKDWKSYSIGQLLYHGGNAYRVTIAGTKTTAPVHTSGTVNGMLYVASPSITYVSGPTSTATVSLTSGNSVLGIKNGQEVPGYSLYDCDGVDYWRYLGWDEHSQRNATRNQTNISIDTSKPMFDNVNTLLDHYGGMMRYSAGKYHLNVEKVETTAQTITDDHIIGKITIQDAGSKSAYSSLTVGYSDPANKFEARNISFFNSEYLRIDRNVPKKGNLSISGVTNYYNCRLLADQFLNKSRFGLTITMTLTPEMIKLVTGLVIGVTYDRYSWVDKKFRITNLTINKDCTIRVVAKEYDDSFYSLSNLRQQEAKGLSGNSKLTTVSAPSTLSATNTNNNDELFNGIELSWSNTYAGNSNKVFTEILASNVPTYSIAVSSISSNNLIFTANHGLSVGDPLTPDISVSNLVKGTKYYVKTVPSAGQVTLSATKGGPELTLTTNGSPGLNMITAHVVDTVPYPTNIYLHSFTLDEDRTQKYYWVRHKVTI